MRALPNGSMPRGWRTGRRTATWTWIPLLFLAGCTGPLRGDRAPSHDPDPTAPAASARDSFLTGVAEDLWGNRIRLDEIREDPVVIQPFSPANCGYCLFDGAFIRENYLERNQRSGGRNFRLCLFNPQLDAYTFQKHERDVTPVLAFPPDLYRYHRDGFPWLIAFREGRLIASTGLHPYEETFSRLRPLLWGTPGNGLRASAGDSVLVPTSPIHMASRFVFENRSGPAVIVVPDGEPAERDAMLEWMRRMKEPPGDPRFESELTPEDLKKNLCYSYPLSRYRHDALRAQPIPIGFDSSTVRIGGRRFRKSEVILNACFPNPYNPARYVLIGSGGDNAVDFALIRRDSTGARGEILLQGYFRKEGSLWAFDESRAYGALASAGCGGGRCPAPVAMSAVALDLSARDAAHGQAAGGWKRAERGSIRSCGGNGARFPSLCAGARSGEIPSSRGGGAVTCWLAWEEAGDIKAADIAADHPEVLAVENDPSDSFHPLAVAEGDEAGIVYLNDREGPYRLKLRRIESGTLARETLLSDQGPFDAVTPSAAMDRTGRLVAVWTEWRANQRFLLTRTLRGSAADPVRRAATLETEDGYVNAWWPAVTFDRDRSESRGTDPHGSAPPQIWSAWNQHYPALLGVCAGDLEGAAFSVTRLAATSPTDRAGEEEGGYPSVAVDGHGTRWVFWESFGWNALRGEAQAIRCASFPPGSKHGPAEGDLSAETDDAAADSIVNGNCGTFFNQTPRAATDARGRVWVVWSGRDREGREPWAIYLTSQKEGGWAQPERVSPAGENARAPAIAAGPDGSLWIAWHAGTGDRMRVRVLRYGRV